MKTKLFFIVVIATIAISLQKANAQNWKIGGNTTSQDTTLGTLNFHSIKIITNNLERIRVDKNGNVGIGTTNPAYKLSLSGSNAAVQINAALLQTPNNSRDLIINAGRGQVSTDFSSGNLSLQVDGSDQGGTLFAGNVGIGTSTPLQKFHVKGASILANNTVINPSTTANTVIAGAIHDGSGWAVTSGIGGKANMGQAWGVGSIGSNLYFGFSDGINDNSMQTGIQITGSRNVLLVPSSGNVGIGTTTPTLGKFVVEGVVGNTVGLFRGSPNSHGISIVADNPGIYFNCYYNSGQKAMAPGFAGLLNFEPSTGILLLGTSSTAATTPGSAISTPGALFIDKSGNIGIGTLPSSNKLDVCGTIRAKEVVVNIGWCDYVFNKDYKLRSLSEVENYISQNKHLPDVPSATEVENKGVKVAQMDSILIKKVEELTLYVIDQNKQIQQLQQKVIQLEKGDADKKN